MTEITRIRSYVEDRWVDGEGEGAALRNPATEEIVARASTEGIDRGAALTHAREVGGPALRELSFAERGEILGRLSKLIRENRDELLELAMVNGGNTRADAKFDVDGASGTLHVYAGIGERLGDERILVDGDAVSLAREGPLVGQHVFTSRRGAAVLVNAYNFPAWGFAEKMACSFLAGLPVVVKPATATALVAYRMAEIFVEAEVLPEGSWTFLGGGAGDLLDHLGAQDVLAFTGSATTGRRMRSHPRVLQKGVRVNVEADSLNAAVLGPDVGPGSETWELFLSQTVHEITQKAGQKCTATRRIVVPSGRADDVAEALSDRLAGIRVGDPRREGVTMGPVTSADQRDDVREGITALAAEGEIVCGGPGPRRDDSEAAEVGYFVAPTLLRMPSGAGTVHEREVFGPVSSVIASSGEATEAADLVARGGGMLVSSVYSDDSDFVREVVLGAAPYHGRVTVGSNQVAEGALPPGVVMPTLVHGGPGRAGAGEELGGIRGVERYMQRTAIQGAREMVDAALGGER